MHKTSSSGEKNNKTDIVTDPRDVISKIPSTSEVAGAEAQLLLASQLPVMFKGNVLSTHHANDATWIKRVVLIMQWA